MLNVPSVWKQISTAPDNEGSKQEIIIMENVKSAQEIANDALPSTVLLEMEDANGQSLGFGSGFFVQENEIATNFHVVEGAHKGSAKLFGQDEWYDIEGYTALDVDNDLIILKIKPPDQTTVDISPLPFGDSDNVRTGDPIYAVGNPAGLEGTISDGIISGIRNRDPLQDMFYTRIQITAPISPGSSGGAVLNAEGEVIGVSVFGMHSVKPISLQYLQDDQYINVAQNLNFAIPSNYLQALLDQQNENDNITPLWQAKLERVTYMNKLEWIGSASYTFPLLNRSSTDVRNVHCSVVFKDKENNEIMRDFVVFPWIIPSKLTKTVIRLSAYDTTFLNFVTPSSIQGLRELGIIDYEETDISNSATESVLLGLADMLLSNMDHADYSFVKPNVKRLMESYEIHILNLEVVN